MGKINISAADWMVKTATKAEKYNRLALELCLGNKDNLNCKIIETVCSIRKEQNSSKTSAIINMQA